MDGKECNNSDSSISEYDPNVDRLDNISHTKSYYSEASWLYDDMEYGEDIFSWMHNLLICQTQDMK